MKLTLLEIVQDILNDLDSDTVNSISDTEESLQVAQVVKTVYQTLSVKHGWGVLDAFGTLDSAVAATPTHMKLSDNYSNVEFVKYNVRLTADTKDKYIAMDYKNPAEFVQLSNAMNSGDADTDIITDFGGAKFNIKNDIMPTYYTSFDDEYLVFDAYKTVEESFLQNSNTQIYGKLETAWTSADTFTPDLPAKSFPYFLSEAKSKCFIVIKQAPNAKEEKIADSGRRQQSFENFRVSGGIKFPNWGRK